jgi:hypothetical protein
LTQVYHPIEDIKVHRCSFLTALLFTTSLAAQTLPADPPVASLPLPDVAVQSLSSAPGRNQAPRPTVTAEDTEAPVRFPIIKKRSAETVVQPIDGGNSQATRFIAPGSPQRADEQPTPATNVTRFVRP